MRRSYDTASKDAMLAHLELLTIKAINYSWVSVRAFHKFIAKHVEWHNLDWQCFKSIQDQATTLFHNHMLHPLLLPRLVDLGIIPVFATVISKMLMLITNIINAECARLIILCYTALNVVHQFAGNDSYPTTPLTL